MTAEGSHQNVPQHGHRRPARPAESRDGRLVTPDHVQRIVGALGATHDLIIVDAWPWLHDTTLTFLDRSRPGTAHARDNEHQGTCVSSSNWWSNSDMRNRRSSYFSTGRMRRTVSGSRMWRTRLAGKLTRPSFPRDGRMSSPLNRGVPFGVASRQATATKDIVRLARAVRGEEAAPEAVEAAAKTPSRESIFAAR